MANGTRVEIFKGDEWVSLYLNKNNTIKYNKVINKIGDISNREISHTNTFSIPSVHENLKALGITTYSQKKLAKALNEKYSSKYFVNEILVQSGYLVINNIKDGVINVNFIDESLDLIERWGEVTYKELLTSDAYETFSDYKNAVSEMEEYSLDKLNIVTPLSGIGTRGYNLSIFPNSLNMIGDKFQMTSNDERIIDTFNPYQCRPVFNAMSVFDLALESFGYTGVFDPLVDWDRMKRTFIVSEGLDKNDNDEGDSLLTVNRNNLGISRPNYVGLFAFLSYKISQTYFNFGSGSWTLFPNNISGWVNPPNSEDTNTTPSSIPDIFYKNMNCIYVPNVQESFNGTINITGAQENSFDNINSTVYMYAVWERAGGGNVVFTDAYSFANTENNNTYDANSNIIYVDTTINKLDLETLPTNTSKLIGIVSFIESRSSDDSVSPLINNINVVETYVQPIVVSYDDNGQYLPTNIDLTHAAPDKSIKELLSALCAKEGILIDINEKDKEVNLFKYGNYEILKKLGYTNSSNYYDFSNYYLKGTIPTFSTNYGNNYGQKNIVGLQEPYLGNTYSAYLNNQGGNSKYVESKENYTKLFKDISNAKRINNTNSYIEYTNTGLGLVESYIPTAHTLTQVRASYDGEGVQTNQGTFSSNNITFLRNLNYLTPPDGIVEWYKLIDEATKVEAKFLIPVYVLKNIDIKKPVYISDLGGFYIIEEIAEYVDGSTPVTIKLIKLINDLLVS